MRLRLSRLGAASGAGPSARRPPCHPTGRAGRYPSAEATARGTRRAQGKLCRRRSPQPPVLPRGRISVPEFGASRRAVARPLPAGCQNDRHRSAVLASRLPWLDFSNFASVRLTSDGRYVAVGTADVVGKRIGGHRRFPAPGPITASSSTIGPMVNPGPFGKEILIFRTAGVLRFADRDSREPGAIDGVDGDVEDGQGDGSGRAKLLPRPKPCRPAAGCYRDSSSEPGAGPAALPA